MKLQVPLFGYFVLVAFQCFSNPNVCLSAHTDKSACVREYLCADYIYVCVVWPPARHMCLKVPQSVDDDDAVNDDDSYIYEKDFQNIQSNLQ